MRAGTVTAIGSLPHTVAADAAAFVLEHLPDLPAAPSLPRRSPHETMLGQAIRGVAGARIDAGRRLWVDPTRLRALDPAGPGSDGDPSGGDPSSGDPSGGDPSGGDAFDGLQAFLAAVAGRRQPIKLQLTGPVTLGIALHDAGAPVALAFEVAATAVRNQARAVVAAATAAAPDAPLLVLLDEPGLTAWGTDAIPLSPDAVIDLVSGALAAIESRAWGGVHCCGPTDWRLPVAAGARVLSLPVDEHTVGAVDVLAGFLERGGWVAWGAVPTSGPVGDDTDLLWRHLTDVWCRLVQGGCDPALLRTQALITPACGLAGHGTTQAARALRLAAELARRTQDQAMAARLSVGA